MERDISKENSQQVWLDFPNLTNNQKAHFTLKTYKIYSKLKIDNDLFQFGIKKCKNKDKSKITVVAWIFPTVKSSSK